MTSYSRFHAAGQGLEPFSSVPASTSTPFLTGCGLDQLSPDIYKATQARFGRKLLVSGLRKPLCRGSSGSLAAPGCVISYNLAVSACTWCTLVFRTRDPIESVWGNPETISRWLIKCWLCPWYCRVRVQHKQDITGDGGRLILLCPSESQVARVPWCLGFRETKGRLTPKPLDHLSNLSLLTLGSKSRCSPKSFRDFRMVTPTC